MKHLYSFFLVSLFTVSVAAQDANDNCNNAITLTYGAACTAGSTTNDSNNDETQEALDMVKQSYLNNVTYSLIFMDCSMPIMDGFESSKCIRKFLSN